VTDLQALDTLERTGPRTAGELATETGLAPASVTALIDRLARQRFVRRHRDPRDRRRVIVEVSPHLRERFQVEFEPLRRAMLERIGRYSDPELRVIWSFLKEEGT
jgi:DNA-binding MarR family transcriptional regulator